MRTAHLAAVGAALCLAALSTTQAAERLDEEGMSQVYAAGLPEAGQHGASSLPAALQPWVVAEAGAGTLERQQQLADARFAAATVQAGTASLQLASAATLATPFAPLAMPVLAMPFPFFMLPPKNAGH